MPAVRFVFALSLLLAPLAAQATEASFDRSLAAVHTKMASGKWDQAIASLDQILIDHKNQVYVQAQSAGIANDYRTSCFYQAYPKPKLKDLLSGKVKSFNPRSGIVKITRRGVLATPAIPSLTAANQLSRFSWSRSCCRGHWT